MQWKLLQKRAIQKPAEATDDLSGDKTEDKITSVSKKSPKELNLQNSGADNKIEIPKERYISPKKKDNKLLMN